jgi:hypothetical protein
VAFAGAKELADLLAFERENAVAGVHGIDQKNNVDRRLAPLDGLKGRDRLRRTVIEDGKILL